MKTRQNDVYRHALSISDDLAVAIRVLYKAGGAIRKSFYKDEIVASCQERMNLVTTVDVEANLLICDLLYRTTPNYAILSEENSTDDEADDHISKKRWIVDPLDATSALYFRSSVDYPASMIALQDGQEICSSAIYFPLTRNIYYAQKGKGAFRNGESLLIRPQLTRLSESWVVMNQYANIKYESKAFALLRDKMRSDIGAKLVTVDAPYSGAAMYMLDGTKKISAVIHDNNPSAPKQKLWDIAPVKLIVEEAGGCVVNLNGEPYDTSNPELILIAKDLSLVDEIVRMANE